MPKLTKTQTYAVLWLHHQANSSEQIAKELKLTNGQVISAINANTKTESPDTDSQSIGNINAKNLMITHTSGQKVNNVAIMTKDASALTDTIKKNQKEINRNDNVIFRPKTKNT